MRINRRAVTVGTTFFLAAATGHVMQRETGFASRVGALAAQAVPAAEIVTGVTAVSAEIEVVTDPMMPKMPAGPDAEVTQLPAGIMLGPRMLKVERGYQRVQSAADVEYSPFGLTCAASSLSVTALPDGLLNITLDAPCHPGQQIVVHHAGLEISASTDSAGHYSGTVPALLVDGAVSVSVAAAPVLASSAPVVGLGTLRRIALRSTDLTLGVYENGAAYQGRGYVSLAIQNGAGELISYGNGSSRTEVYTTTTLAGDIRLEVEAEVTARNCGRESIGELVTLTEGARDSREIRIDMPDCDALGDVVIVPVPLSDASLDLALTEP